MVPGLWAHWFLLVKCNWSLGHMLLNDLWCILNLWSVAYFYFYFFWAWLSLKSWKCGKKGLSGSSVAVLKGDTVPVNVAHVANAAEGMQTTQTSTGTSSWDAQRQHGGGEQEALVTLEIYPKKDFILRTLISLCFGGFFFPHFSYWVWSGKKWLQALGLGYIMIYFYTCLEVGFIGTSLTKNKVIICFPHTIILGRKWHQFAFSVDEWWWASSHVSIGRMSVFFGEMDFLCPVPIL